MTFKFAHKAAAFDLRAQGIFNFCARNVVCVVTVTELCHTKLRNISQYKRLPFPLVRVSQSLGLLTS